MKNILISVIVPAFNIEKYIRRCLDSILQQEYKNLEIIVVNDGSTDETGKIIDEYANIDKRIVAIHKENGGVSSARMKGIENATGEYIGFVDGDDYIEPNMYKYLLNNALKYNAQISHCGYKMVFPDKHEDLYYGTGTLKEQDNKEGIKDLLLGRYIEPGLGNKLYHKEIIKDFYKANIWDGEIRINEDLLLNYLLFKESKKSIYEDKIFYHYILRKGSASTSKVQRYKILDPLKVITLIKEDIVERDIFEIIYPRYIRALLNVIEQIEWKEDSLNTKQKLKKELFNKDFWSIKFSLKLKIMAVIACFSESIYRIIRKTYNRYSGIEDKYKV